jgi:uracil-DNA glycosylase
MADYPFVIPYSPPRGKKGRGRPAQTFDVNSPMEEALAKENPLKLYNFPGQTKQEKLSQLYEMWFACQRCDLGKARHILGDDNIVFFSGNPDAHVLIVGEAPGQEEMEASEAFIGKSGQLLNMLLASVSDDPEIQTVWETYHNAKRTNETERAFHAKIREWRDNEFAVTNVISCQPPENRQPTLPEMKACWERLLNIIYIVDPLLIIACGNTALMAVTRKLSAQITKSRGQMFTATYYGKAQEIQYPVVPILHPSYLGRVADFSNPDGLYMKTRRDIRQAMRIVDFLRLQYFGTPIPTRRGGR